MDIRVPGLLPLLLCLAVPLPGQGIITTAAGGAPFVLSEGPAVEAPLGDISAVALDSAGNVYAADIGNRQVVRINTSGALTIVSGLGLSTDAQSIRIAMDSAGNLFVLDTPVSASARIVKRNPAGQVTTLADGGLSRPSGLALDSLGNLYIADTGNARIRRVAPDGTITTVAGNGTCGFSGDGSPATLAQICEPYAVAVDAARNVYIADAGNSRIRRVTTDGVITTIAGTGERGDSGDDGPALLARLTLSGGLAVDALGNVYITSIHRVRRFLPGGLITTITGSTQANFLGDGGPAISASLRQPDGLALDAAGNLYIADTGNWRVRRIAAGIITTIAGNGAFGVSGDGGPAASASLNVPFGILVDPVGNFYYSDIGSHRVRKIDTRGIITTFAGRGRGFAGDGGPATEALLNSPSDLALDAAGNLYITDGANGRVRRVGTDGIIRTVAGGGQPGAPSDGVPATSAYLAYPTGVSVDSAGNMYIADALGQSVRKVNAAGIISLVRTFFFPAHVTTAGDDLYVSVPALGIGRRDGSVTLVRPDGALSAAVRSMVRPGSAALDNAKNIFVSESFEHYVLRADSAGTTAIAAGTALNPGFSGDGGPATAARLDSPLGAALDAAGNLYIADSGNKRIRRVTPCSFSLITSGGSFIASGGTSGFEVITAEGCAWTARSDSDWITVTTSRGAGRSPVFFSFADNTQAAARTGNVIVAGQSYVVTQEGARVSTGGFEPQMVRRLGPGFYIAEATLAPGAPGGYWGMEAVTSSGQARGGFNLGGGLAGNAANPGFGAFLLTAPQTVTLTATTPLAANTPLTLRFLNANREVIGSPVSGPSPVQFSRALEPGFYIVEITSGAPAPVNYSLGLAADFFAGGVNTGGYMGPGIVGFGAFYVAEEQDVALRLFGRNTYGAAAAGSLVLTLRDAQRNILQVVGP